MAVERRNVVRVVFGHKGYGKSYRVARIVREHKGDVAVWDPMSDFAGRRAGNPVRSLTLYLSARDHLLDVAKSGRVGRVAIQAPHDQFLPWLRAMLKARDCMIVVDEVSLFCSPSKLPAEIGELVRMGRHRNLDQVFVSQRPADVPRILTSNADELILFGIREPRDLDYLRKVSGDALARAVQALPKRRCIVYRGDSAGVVPAPE